MLTIDGAGRTRRKRLDRGSRRAAAPASSVVERGRRSGSSSRRFSRALRCRSSRGPHDLNANLLFTSRRQLRAAGDRRRIAVVPSRTTFSTPRSCTEQLSAAKAFVSARSAVRPGLIGAATPSTSRSTRRASRRRRTDCAPRKPMKTSDSVHQPFQASDYAACGRPS
jgi:hypothetical protein